MLYYIYNPFLTGSRVVSGFESGHDLDFDAVLRVLDNESLESYFESLD